MELFSLVDAADTGADTPDATAAGGAAAADGEMAVTQTAPEMVPFSTDNISQADGYAVAAVGLSIVFFALVFVTVFITVLPRLLERLATVLPEETDVPESVAALGVADDTDVIAAIGYLIHARRQGGGDG